MYDMMLYSKLNGDVTILTLNRYFFFNFDHFNQKQDHVHTQVMMRIAYWLPVAGHSDTNVYTKNKQT